MNGFISVPTMDCVLASKPWRFQTVNRLGGLVHIAERLRDSRSPTIGKSVIDATLLAPVTFGVYMSW